MIFYNDADLVINNIWLGNQSSSQVNNNKN